MTVRSGTCLCGQVTLSVRGEPLRVGICHCMKCRKESGSAFTFYAVWPAERFAHAGETAEVQGQHVCPRCGSRLFSVDDPEVEVKLGVLSDAPTGLVPSYELWVKRREPWLRPIEGAAQYEEDRTR
ncbi:MAG: GFA family protein [Candidatus Binatia bacterium]